MPWLCSFWLHAHQDRNSAYPVTQHAPVCPPKPPLTSSFSELYTSGSSNHTELSAPRRPDITWPCFAVDGFCLSFPTPSTWSLSKHLVVVQWPVPPLGRNVLHHHSAHTSLCTLPHDAFLCCCTQSQNLVISYLSVWSCLLARSRHTSSSIFCCRLHNW